MRLRCIGVDREILEPVVENARGPAKDAQLGRPLRNVSQLLFDQLGMIEIEMNVAAGPDDLVRGEIALLRDHPRQQRGLEYVEGKSQPQIARALEQQADNPPSLRTWN